MKRADIAFVHAALKTIKALLLLGAGALLMFLLYPGFKELRNLRDKNRELDMKILKVEEENRLLFRELKAISTDPDYIEKVARDKLGYGKPNEIVYKFEEKTGKEKLKSGQ